MEDTFTATVYKNKRRSSDDYPVLSGFVNLPGERCAIHAWPDDHGDGEGYLKVSIRSTSLNKDTRLEGRLIVRSKEKQTEADPDFTGLIEDDLLSIEMHGRMMEAPDGESFIKLGINITE